MQHEPNFRARSGRQRVVNRSQHDTQMCLWFHSTNRAVDSTDVVAGRSAHCGYDLVAPGLLGGESQCEVLSDIGTGDRDSNIARQEGYKLIVLTFGLRMNLDDLPIMSWDQQTRILPSVP